VNLSRSTKSLALAGEWPRLGLPKAVMGYKNGFRQHIFETIQKKWLSINQATPRRDLCWDSVWHWWRKRRSDRCRREMSSNTQPTEEFGVNIRVYQWRVRRSKTIVIF